MSYASKSPSSSGSHFAVPSYTLSSFVTGTVGVGFSVVLLLSLSLDVLLFLLLFEELLFFFATAFFKASRTASMIPLELYVAPLTTSTLSAFAVCIAMIL